MIETGLLEYGLAGIVISGLVFWVLRLDTRNEKLNSEIKEVTAETIKSDNDKFNTLKEALNVLKELRRK